MRHQRGSVLLTCILSLPAIMALMILITAAGSLYITRGRLQTAADMAALAGVQELDWDRLAEGQPYLRTEEARAQALASLHLNLQEIREARVDEAETVVEVINASPESPVQHPRTGRWLEYPTVWVLIEVQVTAAGLGERQVRLGASADATVEPRR